MPRARGLASVPVVVGVTLTATLTVPLAGRLTLPLRAVHVRLLLAIEQRTMPVVPPPLVVVGTPYAAPDDGRLSLRRVWPLLNAASELPWFLTRIVHVNRLPTTAEPETLFVFVAIRSGAMTLAVEVAVLLPGVSSFGDETVAVFVSVPETAVTRAVS